MDSKSAKAELHSVTGRMSLLVANAKAEGRDLTNAECDEIEELDAKAYQLQGAVRGLKNAELMDEINAGGAGTVEPVDALGDGRGSFVGSGQKSGYLNTSPAGLKAVAAGMAAQGLKALIGSGSAIAAPLDPKPVPLGAAPLGFLSLFPTKVRDTGSYRWLKMVTRTGNAAVVAPGGLKPTSIYTTSEVIGNLAVTAHVSEPQDRFLLEDNSELQSWLQEEMVTGVYRAAELAAITTLLGTSGVQVVSTGGSAMDRIYAGTIALTTQGFEAKAIVVNSTDYQNARLSKDTVGNYLGGNPFEGTGNPELWRIKTLVTPNITSGTALVIDDVAANLSTDRFGIRTDVDDKSLFKYNQLVFRTEGRFALDVRQPAAVAKITFTP